MADIAIREVANDVWIFSRPFARFGLVPVGGRSTAIKLRNNGGVWVLASTPLSPETKKTIDGLGPVKFIIAADAVHHLFLRDFQEAYPDAKVIAPQATIERADKSLKFSGAWGKDPADTKYGFEDDIQHCYFSGFKNKDVAFFHPESKTLIEADLLFNLPCTEQYSKTNSSGKIPFFGSMGPFSNLHAKIISNLGEDKEAMKRDAKTVAGWDFERIVPCHGDVIEGNGKQAWETLYRQYLQ